MLAQQLQNLRCPAEVVYLDISGASRAVAEARAAARELRNVRFVTASLLDLPSLDLGLFDYVDCTGVLHHLPDPQAGLDTLATAIAPEGGIGIMLYGEYGRSGVYPMQDMLRTLAPVGMPVAQRLAMAKRLMRFLPPTNLFRRNTFLNDHLSGNDAALYDLLLHSQDRAYTVPQVVELTRRSGLRLVAFMEPARYEPTTYMSDPQIGRELASMPFIERATFAERLANNLRTHVFYATKAGYDTVARPEDTSAIPVLREMDAPTLAQGLKPGTPLVANLDGFPWRAQLPPLASAIVAQFDGRKTIAEVYTSMAVRGGLPVWDEFYQQFEQIYVVLNGINHLLLRFRA
jgi:SAM-dependent methyltransferase